MHTPEQEHFARHFVARTVGLIVIPAIVYLFWFWVHFAVLIKSGTGDEFMSPAFQETLVGSPLTVNAQGQRERACLLFVERHDSDTILIKLKLEIRYYDKLIIQHKSNQSLVAFAHRDLSAHVSGRSSQQSRPTSHGTPH